MMSKRYFSRFMIYTKLKKDERDIIMSLRFIKDISTKSKVFYALRPS